MLKIEVIKFEAQDVITASVAAPTVPEDVVVSACTNPNGHTATVTIANGVIHFVCKDCGIEVDATGSIIGG